MNQTERHMKLLATILSTIFHPLLMPTYGIAIALYTSYMRVFGDRLLGIIVIGVLLTTCILPSLGIFILYKTGHISDFRLHNRTERLAHHFFIYQPILENKRTHGSGRSDGCIGIPNEHL